MEASDKFVAAIALKLKIEVYNKNETIFLEAKLCIINKGIVVKNGMIKMSGSTWGDDFVFKVVDLTEGCWWVGRGIRR